MPYTIKRILKESTESLSSKLECSKNLSRMDVEHFLMRVLKVNRSFLYMSENLRLSSEDIKKYNRLLKQRLNGYPLAQILGSQKFYESEFLVDKDVLIPRTETEIIIPEIIKQGDKIFDKYQSLSLIDAGTGSGCIGISLALERKSWKILLLEKELKSLNILNLNLQKLQPKNCYVIFSDWLSSISDNFADIIVSNPPYVDKSVDDVDKYVKKFEPSSALYASNNGLSEIKKIIKTSTRVLKKEGLLFLEIGYKQSENVISLLQKNYYKDIKTILDYNGIKRFIVARHT
ncbi:MAG: peptide chain release factor N(5)-glutamine methyltransferase [Pseudomonadota bacterium]|nr:peptide chain release factor N(5)-glutamine methyltransferase [Pseudomonadota bacterium]